MNLQFYRGTSLPDPDGLLEGTGKELRHVKLRHAKDARTPAVKALVRAAWRLDQGGASVPASEDLHIIEPVDEHGRPVTPGQRSAEVYLTTLYNHTLPLIRYEITDEVIVLPEPCPCGSAHRRIADIQGRADDTFVYGDRPVHPHVFRSALGRRPGIVEYQVRQTPQGATIALRCKGSAAVDSLRSETVDPLARLSFTSPAVTTDRVDRLARHNTGKLARFVPLPPA